MSEQARLHPAAIILNTLKILKDAFLPFVAIIFIGDADDGWWINIIMAFIYMGASTVSGFVKWLTFFYHIENDGIRIHSGVFIKKKRYISFERIHSVDMTEGLLQRLFGLVKLTIDTAGSSDKEGEAVLSAITRAEAIRISELIEGSKAGSKGEDAADEPAEQPIKSEKTVFTMSHKQILIMALTSGRIGVVFAGAFALLGQLGDKVFIDRIFEEVQAAMAVFSIIFLVVVILAILAVTYAIAVIWMMLKYANFTVKKREGDLIITHGLLERRQLTIPMEKIQAVRVVESVIRQPFNLATVYLETASGSAEELEKSETMLFPLISRKRLGQLLNQILGQYTIDTSITPLPKKALPRYIMRQLMFWIPAAGVAIYFFRPIGYLSIAFVFIGAAWGYLSYRAAGWGLEGKQLTLRFRRISKHTYIARKERIQSFTTSQSWFQQKSGLGTVNAYSKTGSGAGVSNGTVADVDEKDLAALRDWFRYH